MTPQERIQLCDDAILEMKKILENSEKLTTLCSLLAILPKDQKQLFNGNHVKLTKQFDIIFASFKNQFGDLTQQKKKFEKCKPLLLKLLLG